MVGQAEHPRADGGEGGHAEHEVDGAVVAARHDLVLAHLLGNPARLERVDPDPHLDAVLTLDLPRLVGQCRLDVHVDVVGDDGIARLATYDLPLDTVDPERAHGGAVEVPGHQIPVPEAEPQAHRARRAGPRPW